MNKLTAFFKLLYEKLFKINDTPQKVALGMGIGVFSGILPGTGPIAALFLSVLFRVNKASALIGCLATNAWISFVTFVLAIKIGSLFTGVNWQDLKDAWLDIIRNFYWQELFKTSILKILIPVAIGYAVIGMISGVISYLITLLILVRMKNRSATK